MSALTKASRSAREAALEAMRREYVGEKYDPSLRRPTIAALSRKYGVPYGAVLYAAQVQGWHVECGAGWGEWCRRTWPGSDSQDKHLAAIADWEEFQRVGYCEFQSRRDRRRHDARSVDVRAAVVDLAAFRAQREA